LEKTELFGDGIGGVEDGKDACCCGEWLFLRVMMMASACLASHSTAS